MEMFFMTLFHDGLLTVTDEPEILIKCGSFPPDKIEEATG
jgi:hypothetical protein